MDVFSHLATGFGVALSLNNLMFVLLGVTVGTVVGLLPGLGPTASIALLLPLTYGLEPETSLILLAGIYYGAMFGGRIPAVLLNVPGDASAVVTTLDGYPLRQQGRAGPALGITAIGSFLGGTVAVIGLTFLAPVLAGWAGNIGPPELFLLTLFGILLIALLTSGGIRRGFAMAAAGMLVASIGMDPITGGERLTFGSLHLSGGINIVPVAVGLFGIGEVLYNAERKFYTENVSEGLTRTMPTWADWVVCRWAIARASVVGFIIGVLPGGGGAVSSVVAYGLQKRVSKNPEKFGKGAIDGLAAAETADNASSISAFIPLLTLGIPSNPVLALMFGALLLQNVNPGPQLMVDRPEIFWGVIASMYIGNVLLLLLNLPLIRVFIQVLRIKGSALAPLIVAVSICGVYSVQNSFFDIIVAFVFGIIGYILKRAGYGLAPFVLAFILAPLMEVHFRRSLIISEGSLDIFVNRPVSAFMLLFLVLMMLGTVWSGARSRREAVH